MAIAPPHITILTKRIKCTRCIISLSSSSAYALRSIVCVYLQRESARESHFLWIRKTRKRSRGQVLVPKNKMFLFILLFCDPRKVIKKQTNERIRFFLLHRQPDRPPLGTNKVRYKVQTKEGKRGRRFLFPGCKGLVSFVALDRAIGMFLLLPTCKERRKETLRFVFFFVSLRAGDKILKS